ncbi:VOC family protein [Alkaliphilus hydrothermalis]|uniref:Enzyme related to lactoylglutathione lyase n=1 Tax=Alkaliphilus hydrothermalis TaxID=1482730 RepID=A0ABS2NMG3_9FIRM|nr:VOC family protein [Alkaliphilus hydrothermalis]MBM7614118.1 putative enzyme related to lactoylglutathione lyase [Alkaliphilus hydrothermalis]
MQGVFHFEVSADHIVRAQRFYKDIFDWNLQEANNAVDYLLLNSNEIKIPELKEHLKDQGDLFVTRINVSSLKATITKILEYGGRVLTKVVQESKELKIYCEDTEGNLLIVVESF